MKPRFLRKPKVFYGYWIVLATFFCLFINSGSGFFAFSLFIKPLQADLGWSRGGIMAGFTTYLLVQSVASPLIGRVVDRYGARRVIAIGAIMVGLGFTLLSQTHHLWYYYLSYAVIGAGMTGIGHIPASTVVSNWFEKRRGTAIGIMSTGIGAGGFALAPLVGGYLIPTFGWRAAYFVLAVLAWALIIPLALFVIRTKPAEMGLSVDGVVGSQATGMAKVSPVATGGYSLRMAVATSGFWLIALSYLAGGFSSVGTTHNQVPYLEDIGFPTVLAASALGGVGLGSLIGKFVFGWLCDRIPAKFAYSLGISLQAIALVILLNITAESSVAVIWLYVLLIGLGAGAWLPTMSILVSTNFGLAAYGSIIGIITSAQSIGIATGPLMAGYLYDTTGTYHRAFIILLLVFAVAIPASLAVRRPKPLRGSNQG